MSYAFVQVSASGNGGGADELNRLLRGGRVIGVRKEFVANGEGSFWAFCVELADGRAPSGVDVAGRGKKPGVDYKEILSEGDFAVYSRLREVRKALAEKDAIPAYSVFTNEQLAQMVREQPQSMAAMGKLAGVGEARIEKYGEAMLKVLATPAASAAPGKVP